MMFEITDNKLNLLVDGNIVGYILYDEKDDYIIGSYIYVTPEMRGRGYALKLIDRFVEFSKDKNKKILPVCPVIKRVIENQYKDVLR